MANLTQDQKRELVEFFADHAQARADHEDTAASIASAEMVTLIPTINSVEELYKAIRRNFDDYAETFCFMEEYSATTHELVAEMEEVM